MEKTIIRTRSYLVELPPAPFDDPHNDISTLLHDFASDVARHIEGVPDEDGLLQAIRPAQERFRKIIRMTAPNFRPFEQKYENQRHLGHATFLVNEEGEEGEDEASEPEDEVSECEDETSECEDESPEDESRRLSAVAPTQPGGGLGTVVVSVLGKSESDGPIRFTLTKSWRELIGQWGSRISLMPSTYLNFICSACTRELPGNYPFVVQKTFIESIIKEWHTLAMSLCNTVHTTLSGHLKKLVHKHFHEFGQGRLEQRVKCVFLLFFYNILIGIKNNNSNTHQPVCHSC